MADEATTQPMLDTILQRIIALEASMSARLERIETQVDRIETQVDRIASVAYETRADLRELKNSLKDVLPALKP